MWMTLRAFGVSGVRTRIADAIGEARWLRGEIAKEPDVKIVAPTPFSVVAFRWQPEGLDAAAADAANARILSRINEDGRTFVSHALVKGRYALRAAIGNARTERRHLESFPRRVSGSRVGRALTVRRSGPSIRRNPSPS